MKYNGFSVLLQNSTYMFLNLRLLLLMELKFSEKYLWFLVVKAYHRFVPHTCPNVPKRPYDRRTLEWPYFDTVIIHCARNRKRLSVKTKKRYERRFRKVKFIYSEKATKFCKIFLLLLTVFTVVKSKGKISQCSQK